MEWTKGETHPRGSEGQVKTRESVSGEYRVVPDKGGRFHAYHGTTKISQKGSNRAGAEQTCEEHAAANKTEFVANVPPAPAAEEVARLADDGNPHHDPADGREIPRDRE